MENKNLTLGSLFDGSGGFPLAGLIAGVTPIWASEIEPFAVRVTTKRLPQMQHYGDVSGISGADLPPVDIITFGSPCFPAGTLVLTDQGYLEIEMVRPGMKVLTHMGRWRKVTDAGAKMGDTVVVKGNHYGLECTPNHPIYSAELKRYYPQFGNGKRGNIRYVSDEKKWTPAEQMEGKLWAVPNAFEPIPIPRPRHDGNPNLKDLPPFSEDFFYLVGRWLGDGWVKDGQRRDRPEGQRSGTIVICAGYDKEEKLRAAVETVEEHYCVERCRTAVKYKFTSLLLCEWLTENFGKYAHGKAMPPWAFSMPENWRRALLQGIMDTDGHQSTDTTYKVTTVSKKLAHGIRLLGETLGYSSTVFHVKMPPTCVIEGRTCNQRDQYVAQLVESKNRSRLSDELHTWYRVRKVIPTGESKLVYNLTVEEDNSYIAEGVVVHNCQDMSIAGKRSGLDGSRSSLFYEAIRIVKEMREKTNGEKPRFICWENVPGAFSSNKGDDFKAVLEAVIGVVEPEAEVPAPEKNGWPYADYYVGDGWSVAYRVLDAQGWGVPQRRARIFLVADFAGERAPAILFESEGVSGYTPEGFRSWQGAAGNPPEGIGKPGGADEGSGGDTAAPGGWIVLNDQGGERMDVTEDITCTLRAEAHHPPVVVDEKVKAYHINQRDEGIDLHGVAGALMATQNAQMQTFVVEESREAAAAGKEVAAAGFCTEHSAKARSIGYEEETSPTLRAGVVPAAIALDYHPADSRIGIGEPEKIQTLTSRMGTGGNNVPLVMDSEPLTPQTLKIRAGCIGGGKGAQIQDNKSATLGCNNDQTVFVPYGICSKASHAMMSDNPHSGFYEASTSRTLDCNGGNPTAAQGGIAIVAFAQNQRDEVRDLNDCAGALAAEPGMKQQTYVLQGSMIGRDDKNGPQGSGVNENVSFTLDTADRHAVAYCMTTGSFTQVDQEVTPTLLARDYKDAPVVAKDEPPAYGIGRDAFNQGINAKFKPAIEEELSPTMVAKGPGAVAKPEEPFYIVRRLTPTECARLQGFPDWWCADLGTENPTEEEIAFWTDVFETHRKIVTGTSKLKTEKQIRKWLADPYSDSAEYKLWGNGIALPCAYFVLSGIVWAASLEE